MGEDMVGVDFSSDGTPPTPTLLRKGAGSVNGYALRRNDMRAKTEYLTFCTKKQREYIRITDKVREVVEASGVAEGFALVSAMHITAAVYVNDAESGLIADIDDWLEKLAPYADYRHHRTGEVNGDAHLKNLLLHHQVVVPITAGQMDLGPWQQIYYAEFDGKRPKRMMIKVVGAGADELRGQ
jgi:secondary thiamine-phosphate synthase enzyme